MHLPLRPSLPKLSPNERHCIRRGHTLGNGPTPEVHLRSQIVRVALYLVAILEVVLGVLDAREARTVTVGRVGQAYIAVLAIALPSVISVAEFVSVILHVLLALVRFVHGAGLFHVDRSVVAPPARFLAL